ncbi:TlpA disulfide reductase family protein [uncultured Marixanthomonas sp.]|uniref:TlpA disulfide reductase family protein n=1 Tax=uncultured Marixanthomonas sp. TaxID=757245 RepID=UPI0030D90730|tara:strand:+ start:76405 stop:77520 length:1116 start_codon:yes stop_codon:yes gene_type:complete
MKTATILIGIISFVTILGCSESKNPIADNQFVLKGELEGIENDSWIYLIFDNQTVDSTKTIDSKFTIKGNLEHPKQYKLLVKNSKNFSNIWLEPGEIKFKAKNGEFKEAIIKGSNSQKESDKLWNPIWEYRNRRDSLSQIVANDKLNDSSKINARLKLKKIRQNWLKIEREFIKKNPKSYVSANTLDFYSTTLPKKTVSELYNNLSENVKKSSYGMSVKRFLELNKNPQIGDKYVDFSMTNEKDELIRLSDFEGKLLLLDFWASWCGPCIKEYPTLRKAYLQFNKDKFEIVSVSEDQSKERWLKAIEENELNWINLWQDDGNKADPYLIYGISGIPDNLLIDKNGIIIARNLRGESLISKIEDNLENKGIR